MSKSLSFCISTSSYESIFQIPLCFCGIVVKYFSFTYTTSFVLDFAGFLIFFLILVKIFSTHNYLCNYAYKILSILCLQFSFIMNVIFYYMFMFSS